MRLEKVIYKSLSSNDGYYDSIIQRARDRDGSLKILFKNEQWQLCETKKYQCPFGIGLEYTRRIKFNIKQYHHNAQI